MEDFFQSYGSWKAYGGMTVAMVLMHVLGIGHGGHGHDARPGTTPPGNPPENEKQK